MEQLKNSVTMPVVDRFGYLVETQQYPNPPLSVLYQDEPVAFLQEGILRHAGSLIRVSACAARCAP